MRNNLQTPLVVVTYCLVVLINRCYGYASDMMRRCSLSLTAGTSIMGSNAFISTGQNVQVARSGTLLSSGSSYNPGETLQVYYSTSGERVFQTTGGTFTGTGSGCSGARSSYNGGSIQMPASGSAVVNIWAGYATSYGPVRLTNTFVLNPPVSPTMKPSISPSSSTYLPSSAAPSLQPSPYPSGTPTNRPVGLGEPTNQPQTDTPTFSPTTPFPSLGPSSANPSCTPTSFFPSVLPSKSPTAAPTTRSPTARPSCSPTDSPNSAYFSILLPFYITSVKSVDVWNAQGDIRGFIANALSLSSKQVLILDISDLSRTESAALKFLSSLVHMQGFQLLASSASVEVYLQILNIQGSARADTIMKSLSTYLTTSFSQDLTNFGGLTVASSDIAIGTGTVAESSSGGIVTSDDFSFNCAFSPDLKIFWKLNTDGKSITAKLSMKSSTAWFAGGIVRDASTKMFSSSYPSTNKVFFYAPDISKVGIYSINGYSAGEVVLDSNQPFRKNMEILSVQIIDGVSNIFFAQGDNTGVSSDPKLIIESGKGNSFMWAQGGIWPAIHVNEGTTIIYWKDGTCRPKGFDINIYPYIIFPVMLVLLIISRVIVSMDTCYPFLMKKVFVPSVGDISYMAMIPMLCYLLAIALIGFAVYNEFRKSVDSVSLDDLIRPMGAIAMMNFWMAIYPTSKTSFFVRMIGVPYDRIIKFHKMFVTLAMVSGFIHLWLSYASKQFGALFLSAEETSGARVIPLFGLIAFIAVASMSLLAFEPIRRAQYEIFLFFHAIWVPFVVLTILHIKNFGFYPAIALHAIDHIQKLVAICHSSSIIDATYCETSEIVSFSIHVTPSEIAQIMAAGGGSYYFLLVPKISLFQWHPISIAEFDTEASVVRFHVKAMKPGSFTYKLYQMVRDGGANDLNSIKIARFGIFGKVELDLSRYQHIVMVAGGIGITPMINQLQMMISLSKNNPSFQKVSLVWVVRGKDVVRYIQPSLPCFSLIEMAERGTSGADVVSVTNKARTSAQVLLGEEPVESNSTRKSFQKKYVSVIPSVPDVINKRLEISYEIFDTLIAEKSCSNEQKQVSPQVDVTVKESFGRPDFNAFFEAISKELPSQSAVESICVLICGPQTLTADVSGICNRLTIDYHAESFSW